MPEAARRRPVNLPLISVIQSTSACNPGAQPIRLMLMRLIARCGLVAMGLAVLTACSAQSSPTEALSSAPITAEPCTQPPPAAPRVALNSIQPEQLILCDITIQTVSPGATSEGAPEPVRRYRTAPLSVDKGAILLALLQSSPEPASPGTVCPAPDTYVSPICLRLTDGRIAAPTTPSDSCGQPPPALIEL